MAISIFPILLLLLTVGMFLFIRGLRGRRIDDHPLCRRCGFDLIGLPEGAGRCSECGADLHAPDAIRHGHRKKRAGLIASGAAMLSVVLLFVIVGIYAAATNTNWQQYKPAWWLIRETASGDVKLRDDALVELSARLTAGNLSQEQIDKLADRALALQADPTKPWSGTWGDLIESAYYGNKLSDARWQRYLVQAPSFKLEIRPDVRRGDRIPYWIRQASARVGNKSQLYVNHSSKDWTIGPITKTETSGGGTTLNLNGSGATGSSIMLKKDELAQLKDGKQDLHISMELKIGKNGNAPAMATTNVTLQSSFTLRPENEPTAVMNTDPSHRAAVEKALTCERAEHSQTWNPQHLNVSINVDQIPVGIGYDVFAVIGGKEVKVGTFSCPAGTNNHSWGMGAQVPPFEEATVDLVLKPNLSAAIATTNTFEVWDGEVRIRNVPVKRPATNPATTRTAR